MQARISNRGLSNVAPALETAPGNLSHSLSGQPDSLGRVRKFGVDDLEDYIKEFDDREPVYYLVEKYLTDENITKQRVLNEVSSLTARCHQMLDELEPD